MEPVDLELEEDMHQNLKNIFISLDRFCKEKGLFPDVVADYPEKQGFLIRPKRIKDELYKALAPDAEKFNVHMDLDDDRADGLLVTFSIKAINDDGNWNLLTDKDKETQSTTFSPLPNSDAERVRRNDTMYQKNVKLKHRLDFEGQYKSPTKKHLRSQSAFRSPIGKVKSFGGIEEMIAPFIEPSSDLAGEGGLRNNPMSAGEPIRKPKSYNQRVNAVDMANMPPYQQDPDFNSEITSVLGSIVPDATRPVQGSTQTTPAGMPTIIPDAIKNQQGAAEALSVDTGTTVIPSDAAAQEADDFSLRINNPVNLHVTMAAGIRPQTPTGEVEPVSNVTSAPAGGGGGSFMASTPIVRGKSKKIDVNKPKIG